MSFSIVFSRSIYVGLEKVTAPNTAYYMLESIRRNLDKGLKTKILLTDRTEAFDSISHDLLIAKLNAYGFTINSLKLINNYLTGRRQRTKVERYFQYLA